MMDLNPTMPATQDSAQLLNLLSLMSDKERYSRQIEEYSIAKAAAEKATQENIKTAELAQKDLAEIQRLKAEVEAIKAKTDKSISDTERSIKVREDELRNRTWELIDKEEKLKAKEVDLGLRENVVSVSENRTSRREAALIENEIGLGKRIAEVDIRSDAINNLKAKLKELING